MTAYSCETQCLLLLFLVSVRRRHNIRKLSYSLLDIVFCLSLHSLKFYYKKRFKKIIHLCFGTTHNDILRTFTKVRSDVHAKKKQQYTTGQPIYCIAVTTVGVQWERTAQYRKVLDSSDTCCVEPTHYVE